MAAATAQRSGEAGVPSSLLTKHTPTSKLCEVKSAAAFVRCFVGGV
jgi:hypothetical protein